MQVLLNFLLLSVFFSCEKNSTESTLTVPEILTSEPIAITQTSAQSGGIITSDGGAFVTVRGVCWNTIPEPTIANDKTNDGTGAGSFTSNISGLTSGALYYIRAYAINSVGTGYGSTISFSTDEEAQTGTVTDIDGNIYATIKIGNQWWMTENLKVKHYRNGELIPLIAENEDWENLITEAFCFYNNDSNYSNIYGLLYNWYTIDNGNIAPDGWHVPTNTEWQILVDYLGGHSFAGGKLKEAGTIHWESPNEGATNESGFSGLPGGYRNKDGVFYSLGYYAYFWSSTETNDNNAWYRYLSGSDMVSHVYDYGVKGFGYSIRCVKNN